MGVIFGHGQCLRMVAIAVAVAATPEESIVTRQRHDAIESPVGLLRRQRPSTPPSPELVANLKS
jgi:hypothetical protein